MFIVYSGPESSTVFRESLSRLKSLHYKLKNDAASKRTCPHFVIIDYRILISALFDLLMKYLFIHVAEK